MLRDLRRTLFYYIEAFVFHAPPTLTATHLLRPLLLLDHLLRGPRLRSKLLHNNFILSLRLPLDPLRIPLQRFLLKDLATPASASGWRNHRSIVEAHLDALVFSLGLTVYHFLLYNCNLSLLVLF